MGNINLKGHSGCLLSLENNDGFLVVTKTSKDFNYNERLKKQCEKQKNTEIGGLISPRVLASGLNDDNLFYFIMEYVSGQTLSEYFKNIRISEINKIAGRFISIIPEKYLLDDEADSIFSNKIVELDILITKKTEIFDKVFELLKKYNWGYCAKSACHGDMTFENIILKDGEIYLIDFLDSFYDSWMIDLSKLLQDIECKWSYRNDINIDENLEIRLLIFKNIIFNKILSLENGQKILETIYYMLLLNLIRIIPYANDKKTMVYLENNICNIYNKIINFK